ncbi:MAG: aldehyde:ferredoxin oxidoreductase [Nitrospiraceae bacterium]|nr:aldehyde:ferredoxin oxidoreductase [Nitrospiraceae bacterium]
MATKLGGYTGKILKIDLTNQEVGEYPWSDDDRAKYLGGKVMAAKILYDWLDAGTEPFSPDNPLVITTGPLTGTGAPSSSRFNVSARSPLTRILASSNCGGNFGLHLKKAGYDAVIISGKSEKAIWVEITDEDVLFHDAAGLWGKTTSETQEALGGQRGKMVIGPAGENLVKFAGIFCQERTAGRAGLGAVMGSKNLKAITATGKCKVEVHDREKMKKVYKSWVKLLANHPLTGDALPKYGSAFMLRRMQKHRMLATRNFSDGRYKDYDAVSGQTLAETRLVKNWGCPTCPVKCSRQVELNGKLIKGPELETLALLGPNLDNNDLDTIIRWNYQLDELGMDTITAGGVIGFVMELQEKGLWDTGLEFGKTENVAQVFDDIAHRRGIGDLLAEGTRALSEKFGGKEFAAHSKGLELAAYEPRGAVGHGLGYATSNRGACHLNGGYLVLVEGLGLHMNPHTPRAKAAFAILNQNLMEAVSSAPNCLFPLFSFYPGWIMRYPNGILAKIASSTMPFSGPFVNVINRLSGKWSPIHLPLLPHTKALSAVTGLRINLGSMKDIGERGYNLERMVNVRFGITAADDSLPKRFTDDNQVPGDPRTKVPLEVMKAEYYRIRGWDTNGAPTPNKQRKLGLA